MKITDWAARITRVNFRAQGGARMHTYIILAGWNKHADDIAGRELVIAGNAKRLCAWPRQPPRRVGGRVGAPCGAAGVRVAVALAIAHAAEARAQH